MADWAEFEVCAVISSSQTFMEQWWPYRVVRHTPLWYHEDKKASFHDATSARESDGETLPPCKEVISFTEYRQDYNLEGKSHFWMRKSRYFEDFRGNRSSISKVYSTPRLLTFESKGQLPEAMLLEVRRASVRSSSGSLNGPFGRTCRVFHITIQQRSPKRFSVGSPS